MFGREKEAEREDPVDALDGRRALLAVFCAVLAVGLSGAVSLFRSNEGGSPMPRTTSFSAS